MDTNAPAAPPMIDDQVETWFLGASTLPVFIGPIGNALDESESFLAWVRRHRATLDSLVLAYGGIVLRGFPLRTAEDFDAFAGVFPSYEGGYVGGGAPRAVVTGKVMEATRVAKESVICLHQEMAYLKTYPPRLAFFCRKPADVGGETIIGSMREFTRRLPEHVRDLLTTRGVRGVRNYLPAGQGRGVVADARDGMAWDEGFRTSDRAEVEQRCAERELKPVWRDDGGLAVITYLTPFSDHPKTGERFYRSIIHTTNIDTVTGKLTHKVEGPLGTGYTYGDGTPMPVEDAQKLHDILDDITVCWKWQAGDVMIVDNLQTAHGRNRYQGERETLVALLA